LKRGGKSGNLKERITRDHGQGGDFIAREKKTGAEKKVVRPIKRPGRVRVVGANGKTFKKKSWLLLKESGRFQGETNDH